MLPVENCQVRSNCDRYIAQRKGDENFDFKIMKTLALRKPRETCILRNIFPFVENNILNFKAHVAGSQDEKARQTADSSFDQASVGRFNAQPSNLIRDGASQIIEAPGFRNDYYLHLLDAADDNTLGVILASSIFLVDRAKNKFSLVPAPLVEPTSLAFSRSDKTKLATGLHDGGIHVVDLEKGVLSFSAEAHEARVGILQWNPVWDSVFAAGSKDNQLSLIDLREPNVTFSGENHFGEVCGLAWNSNGWTLASGGNDNVVHIWDSRCMKAPVRSIEEHRAAVRAISWCPWNPSLLATGGGSGDMRLLVTNVEKNKIVRQITTSSQVCALLWEEEVKGIMTAHGFSKYQLALWRFDSSELLYEFLGHKNRILSMVRPAGTNTVITASADESIRAWNMRQFIKPLVRETSQLAPVFLR